MSISQGGQSPFIHVNGDLTPFRATALRPENLTGAVMFAVSGEARTMFSEKPSATSPFFAIGPTQFPGGTEGTQQSFLVTISMLNAMLAMQRRGVPAPSLEKILSKWKPAFMGVQVSDGEDPFHPTMGPSGKRPIDTGAYQRKRGRYIVPLITMRASGVCELVTTPLLKLPLDSFATSKPMVFETSIYAVMQYVPIPDTRVYRVDNLGTPADTPRGGMSDYAYQVGLVACNGPITPDMIETVDDQGTVYPGAVMKIGEFIRSKDEIFSEKAHYMARDPTGSFSMRVHPHLWE